MAASDTEVKETRTCSRCRSRPAVYLRSSSGEALCRRCLWDEVVAQSARAVSGAGPGPRSRFLVPVSSFAPSSSLIAAAVLSSIERRFPSTVIVAVPSFYGRDLAGRLKPDERLQVINFYVTPPPPPESDIISCIRYDRAWSARAAASVGAEIVVLPLSRTDLTAALLEALLTDRPEGVFDSQASYNALGVRFLSLFSMVEREAVAALEYLEGLLVPPACRPLVLTKAVLMSIAGAPERDYGGLVIPIELARAVRSPTACAACGAPSREPLCQSCGSLGLGSLDVRPLGRHPGATALK